MDMILGQTHTKNGDKLIRGLSCPFDSWYGAKKPASKKKKNLKKKKSTNGENKAIVMVCREPAGWFLPIQTDLAVISFKTMVSYASS